jgi:hypothetical protein
MTNNAAVVGCNTNVEFEAVASVFECEIKSCNCVLSKTIAGTAYAAMTEKKGASSHFSEFYANPGLSLCALLLIL